MNKKTIKNLPFDILKKIDSYILEQVNKQIFKELGANKVVEITLWKTRFGTYQTRTTWSYWDEDDVLKTAQVNGRECSCVSDALKDADWFAKRIEEFGWTEEQIMKYNEPIRVE